MDGASTFAIFRGRNSAERMQMTKNHSATDLHTQEVTGSSPAVSTNKETSFVYQGKRGFFLHFGRKMGKYRQNKGINGLSGGQKTVQKPDFLFSGRKNGRKCWCTFGRSLHQQRTPKRVVQTGLEPTKAAEPMLTTVCGLFLALKD